MEALTSYAPPVSNLCCSNRRNGNLSSSPALIHNLRYPISYKSNVGRSHFISLRFLNNSPCSLITRADVNVNSVTEPCRSKTVHVRFQLQKECMFGEQFLIVGDDPILGLWEPSNAIPLDWSDEHIWRVNLDLPVGKSIFYKFILKGTTEEVFWQPGPDRMLETWETMNTIVVSEDWEDVEVQNIIEELYEENIQEADPETIHDDNVTTAEESMVNEDLPLEPTKDILVAETILGKNGTVVPGNAQDDNLASYAGEPVLVPGLTPLTSREEVVPAEPESSIVSDVSTVTDEAEEPGIVSDVSTVTDEAEEPGMPKHESGLEEKQQIPGEHDRAEHQAALHETLQNDFTWGRKTLHKLLTTLGISLDQT